jgi:hypothetical protein
MWSRVSRGLEELEMYDLSIQLALVAKSYRSMLTYNNQFKAALWPEASNMATYNLGVVRI